MIDVDNLTKRQLAGLLDSTFLKAFGGPEKIEELCREAAEYGFASVAVNGAEVARCAALLKGTGVKVDAAVGFPLGQMTAAAKLFETREAIAQGAGEVDVVLNVRRLQAGDTAYLLAGLKEFAHICREGGALSKVIFENCYLNEAEKILACRLACEAGVDFVKTSTGFGTGGATVEDVALMRREVGPAMGVKAAGGIRTTADALAMLRAGATRLGTSAGRAIVEGFQA